MRGRTLDLRVLSLDQPARVGLVVARFAESAVARNRVKRRLRAIVSLAGDGDLPRGDVVVIANPSAYRATYHELDDDYRALCRRANAPRP